MMIAACALHYVFCTQILGSDAVNLRLSQPSTSFNRSHRQGESIGGPALKPSFEFSTLWRPVQSAPSQPQELYF